MWGMGKGEEGLRMDEGALRFGACSLPRPGLEKCLLQEWDKGCGGKRDRTG